MPLTDCPECSNKVSSSAHICPKCGFRLRRILFLSSVTSNFVNLVCFLVLVASVGVVVIKDLRNGKHRNVGVMSEQEQLARERLGGLCVPYSRESFLEQVKEGDYLSVKLFLQAGMVADSKDASGLTAIQIAQMTDDQKLVKLLQDSVRVK